MSAYRQFSVGTQLEVSLLLTTQIISGVSFITAQIAFASTSKNKTASIESELFLLPRADAPYVPVYACFHSCISTQTFRRALTASVDSCAEIKSSPSVA